MKRIAACLLLLLLWLPVAACGASYSIEDYSVQVDVDAGGAGHFEETLRYDFDGEHNGFLITIRHEDGLRLSSLTLYADRIPLTQVDELNGVPYTYSLQQDAESTSAKVYAPGARGERQFSATYRIDGFARRYLDAGRINHLFLPGDTAYESVTVSIALPGDDDAQIQAFVHGPARDEPFRLEGGVFTLGPIPAQKGNALEIDILFPEHWLSQARAIQTPIRQEALAAEAEIEQQTIANAQRREQTARTISQALLAALLLYAAAPLLLFLHVRRKYGLKHPRQPVWDPIRLDDIPAAQAQVLISGQVDSSALSATLMELVDCGALAIAYDGEDTVFTVRHTPHNPTQPQQTLWAWLFANRASLHISSLDAGDDTKAAEAFTNDYNQWKTGVLADTRTRGWLHSNDVSRIAALIGVPLLGAALAAFLFRYSIWLPAIAALLLAVLFGVAFSRIRKLTDEGEAHRSAIDGFLQSYEDKLSNNPQSVLVRMPLLTALGYLPSLAAWIDSHPQENDAWNEPIAMPMYFYHTGYPHALLQMDQNIREAQSHNLGTATQGDPSSGTSGGGFSGGSGGSSHGAW